MLRLKANKTSLYKLVAKYEKLPAMVRTEFIKAPRNPDYFLRWTEQHENVFLRCEAFLAACLGKAKLTIEKKYPDDWRESRVTYGLELESLLERGMVEKFTTAAERRQAERRAACGTV